MSRSFPTALIVSDAKPVRAARRGARRRPHPRPGSASAAWTGRRAVGEVQPHAAGVLRPVPLVGAAARAGRVGSARVLELGRARSWGRRRGGDKNTAATDPSARRQELERAPNGSGARAAPRASAGLRLAIWRADASELPGRGLCQHAPAPPGAWRSATARASRSAARRVIAERSPSPHAAARAGRRELDLSSVSIIRAALPGPAGLARLTGQRSPEADMERKWWTLIAVCVATFMLLLDITIVNVALPDIQKPTGASFTELQWVVDAYSLTLAAPAADGRLARRPARAPAGLRRRPRHLHGRLAALRPVGRRHGARPRARPPGHRRRGDVRHLAGAAGAGVPRARARHGVRHLGRDDRRRRRDRAARRRRAHRGLRLGVDLLRQRPDRDRRRSRSRWRASTSRATRRAAASTGPGRDLHRGRCSCSCSR